MNIFSVNELTNYLRNIIENDVHLQSIIVKGEVSNFRKIDNHAYFSLKDEFAIVECVMFSQRSKLEFNLQEGMIIMVKGAIEIYRKRGNYQIIVENISLSGKGELYTRFLQLKEKLQQAGLFDESHKKTFPLFPKKIGIITSLEAAALHDMLKVFSKKCSAEVFVYHSLVQGDKAKFSLIKGIKVLEELSVEVIILARGGGSFEDLFVFNDEQLAYAIYNSKIPIITGIGHETDSTIADFVADKRAATPTAAAEFVLKDKKLVQEHVIKIKKLLYSSLYNHLEKKKKEISFIIQKNVSKIIMKKIHEFQQEIDDKKISLVKKINIRLQRYAEVIKNGEKLLVSLNPENVMARGYTMIMKNDKITSFEDIEEKDIITAIFKNGKIHAHVIEKEEHGKNI